MMPSVGAVTVAVSDPVKELVLPAVAKPFGVVMTKFVLPAASGWNAVVCTMVSPVKTTGLVTIVPTVVMELVTVTFTLNPVRTFCEDCQFSVAGSSCTETTLRDVSGEKVVVLRMAPNPLLHTKPEGVRFTVTVPLL